MPDAITIVGVAVLSATGGAIGRNFINRFMPSKKEADNGNGNGKFSLKTCLEKHKQVDERLVRAELIQIEHDKRLNAGSKDFKEIKQDISSINGNIQVLLDRSK